MAIGRDVVAVLIADLARTSERFVIEVERRQIGHGSPAKRSRRRTGPIEVSRTYEVTAAKLVEAAERLKRGEATGVLAEEVDRLEFSFRLLIVWTRSNRVRVRGRSS